MIKPKTVSPGQTVKAKDAKGFTTYGWLATFSELEGLLGGSGPPPAASAKIAKTVAQSSLTVSAASYNGSTFTPGAVGDFRHSDLGGAGQAVGTRHPCGGCERVLVDDQRQ